MKKTLRTVLCLMLAISLFSGAALAETVETYTDDWGNGVTLDFEIDDSLLQTLDIFDAYYKLPLQDASEEQITTAKDLLQQAIMTFHEETPTITESETHDGYALYALSDEWGDGYEASYSGSEIECRNEAATEHYMNMEVELDSYLSKFSKTSDSAYKAVRNDFYTEHDYMTHDEADDQAQSFMSTVCGEGSPFGVVLRDWYGMTGDQFFDFFYWKAKNNLLNEESNLTCFTGEDWSEKYDSYYLLYSYTYKGYPICDDIQTSYYGSYDSLSEPTGFSTSCLINRDGLVYAGEDMLFDCDYTPYEDTPALTLYEALDVLKSSLGDSTLLNPIEINRVYVEYVPYYVYSDDSKTAYKLTFEPVWNFVADMTTKKGVVENAMVYRVNAHTGDIMTDGTGIIE